MDHQPGRTVVSRGPIIRTLEIASALTSICAVLALILALGLFSHRIDTIQASRRAAAVDNCALLTTVISIASGEQHKRRAGRAFLHRIGLSSCTDYANHILHATKPIRLHR